MMPLPLFSLAIPVIHSSGAWIASTSGTYFAGTMSSSWITSFVLGNVGLITNIGLVSAGSVVGALVACGSSITAGISSIFSTFLVKVGLGSLSAVFGYVIWGCSFVQSNLCPMEN